MANVNSDNVSVLLGHGDGTFAGDVTYGTGDVPRSVAIGDLDGDGHADLVVANVGSDNVSVLLGHGDGNFADDVTYGTGDAPRSVAIGDLDGDGHADLAVANSRSDNVSVLLGHGDGTFAADVTYGAGDAPLSLAIGDLDGDGDTDLIVANFFSDNISALLNRLTNDCDSNSIMETLQLLIEQIEALGALGILNQGQVKSLVKKCENIIANVDRGQIIAACNQLGAVIHEATSFINVGVLPANDGQPLVDTATNVRCALSCEAKGPAQKPAGAPLHP